MGFKNSIKSIIFFCLNAISAFLPKRRAAILLYHSVDKNDVYLTVKPEIFEKQMHYLKVKNYQVISLEELAKILHNNKKIHPKTIILTFDDGFLSHYEKVFPILKKYNFPATFFISTGLVGGSMDNSQRLPQPTMTWEQITEMSRSPLIDIEPHGINHRELDGLSLAEVEHEIVESKNEIEMRLNKKCHFFAPPRGKYSKAVTNLIKKYNFDAIAIIEEGLIKASDDLFILRRNTINSSCANQVQFLARLNWSVALFNLIKF